MFSPVTPARQDLVPAVILPARLPVVPVIHYQQTAIPAVNLAEDVSLNPARAVILPARLPVVPVIHYQQAAIPAVYLAENALPIPVPAIHFHTARQELQVALDVNPVPLPNIKSTAVRSVIRHLAVPVYKATPAPDIRFPAVRLPVPVRAVMHMV